MTILMNLETRLGKAIELLSNNETYRDVSPFNQSLEVKKVRIERANEEIKFIVYIIKIDNSKQKIKLRLEFRFYGEWFQFNEYEIREESRIFVYSRDIKYSEYKRDQEGLKDFSMDCYIKFGYFKLLLDLILNPKELNNIDLDK